MLRFACTCALALATATVCAQNSPPPAPAPGRTVPTSPEAAPTVPAERARTAGAPARNAPIDTTALDAEHQAARARCEAEANDDQEACLRAADQAYERALGRDELLTGQGVKEAGIH